MLGERDCTISCLSLEHTPPPPPPAPLRGKFSSTARWKALQSLYCTIRRLFVLFVAYSRTIRTIRRLFADYSHYSSTIRGLFALFVDYSHYSSTIRTIRTIRFTILVLSIAASYIEFHSEFYLIEFRSEFLQIIRQNLPHICVRKEPPSVPPRQSYLKTA